MLRDVEFNKGLGFSGLGMDLCRAGRGAGNHMPVSLRRQCVCVLLHVYVW